MKRIALSLLILAVFTSYAFAFGLGLVRMQGRLGASSKKGSGTAQNCTQGLTFNAACNSMYIPFFVR